MVKSPGKKNEIDAGLVRRLAELLDETNLTEIEYGQDGWHVRVSKAAAAGPAPSAPSAAPAATDAGGEAAATAADHPGVVTSPMVGMVYMAEEPGAPPLVQVGDTVSEGQNLLLIEAMKVFNPIKAPRAGRVMQILVANETPVEFGEPLLIIE